MSLARQFALAGGAVMLFAVLAVGLWVSRWIEEVVVRNSANATALYMESFIAPLMQDLAERERLTPEARLEIDRLIKDTALGQRVLSFKLWRKGGLLADASTAALVGRRFEVTENLRLAWDGQVRADFDDTGDAEDVAEAALGLPLLEIYSPIREIGSGEVIAVAEFYEVATQLENDLRRARLASFAAVTAVMGAIGVSLFAIVLRGSWTIDRQMAELESLSRRNHALRLRAQDAAGRVAALNDSTIKRIGADLHDGPAQLLGFAALRLDALRAAVPEGGAARADLDAVERAVRGSISEIRSVARGLSLPDIERRPIDTLLRALAEAHAERSGAAVQPSIDIPPGADLPVAAKTCAYRVAQEGLTNAWRHAGGQGQELRLRLQGNRLQLSVLDRGPGFGSAGPGADDDDGMGLSGLADRVESLGGRLETRNRPDGGAELRMTLDIGEAAG
ncbi:histidine kinase [Rhodobacter sp. Har01]|uniref:sensor histidine kinase n=1 Tax=Rhodobacter sp. Har01 TaxID=2883999 RepID=UPI001D061305|nr:histidine kinase [Rhodobacter sp. Har01]MCB6178208.1 histidine kinase [Rhodobacter sp. Har01]